MQPVAFDFEPAVHDFPTNTYTLATLATRDPSRLLIAFAPDRLWENGQWLCEATRKREELYKGFVFEQDADVLLLTYYDQFEPLTAEIDGWLIPGGSDIHPSF